MGNQGQRVTGVTTAGFVRLLKSNKDQTGQIQIRFVRYMSIGQKIAM
jgi:hypothetical protein